MEGTTEHMSASSAENRDKIEVSSKRPGKARVDATATKTSNKNNRFAKAADLAPRDPVEVNLRTLLQAGVHFGHQTSRWNPAMAPYIYGSRNGIHILNLPKTVTAWEEAKKKIAEVASRGGNVLFVGTKKQAQDVIVEEARRCGAFYVSRRWLGGMMTNFQTIRKSIERLNKIEQTLVDEEASLAKGEGSRFTKKERLMMSKEREKLEYSLGGIRDMYGPPQLMFVIDVKREDIAIKEAQRLDIPVVALVDTNCDPSIVNFPIPSNDDGTRAIRLFASAISDTIIESRKKFAGNTEKPVVAPAAVEPQEAKSA